MSPAAKKSSSEMTTCPWCSASVPADAATCPSCGASLKEAAGGDILGVTQIDPSVVSRIRRIKSRNIASFLGVSDSPDAPDVGGKVEPPSEAVRREMLRLELAAIDAEIEAKAKEVEAQRALPPDDAPGTPSD